MLLGACSVITPAADLRDSSTSATAEAVRDADALMPPAPYDQSVWSQAVSRAYASAGGGIGAEAWLRRRMEQRTPGERLAVIMGVDDVIVQTHFGGLGTLVPQSVRFVREAHALGYAVFFVTGRTWSDGLGQVESLLARRHVPAGAFFAPPVGSTDEATAKAKCRATIQQEGYTLAVSVAADGASFVGSPSAQLAIRLPDFAKRT